MSFLSAAKDGLANNKAKELEGKSEEEESSIKPREFFWDNIVLFVVSTILGLAAIDVITEFLRGGNLTCFTPLGVDVSDAQAAYINNFCSSFQPRGAYVPAFMVVHAVLITAPHYLWLSHYGGNFEYFFQLASKLNRLHEDQMGESADNLNIVQHLESTFTLYRRKTIYTLYAIKLVVQLVWTIFGIAFAIGFFIASFDVNFECPPNFDNSTMNQFWPLNEPVVCTFETLSLLRVLWLATVLLLFLVCFSLVWALIWCRSTHPTELGYKEVALFAFRSGFAPLYYVPKLPLNFLHQFFIALPYPSCSSKHTIVTDLDFLVLRLYQTDSGLGHVFKEVLIRKKLKDHLDDDHRQLSLHRLKHLTIGVSDGECVLQS